MKKLIFFDGDGTLWYPKKTKHNKGAWKVYELPGGHKEHNKHLILTPTTYSTLKKLKKRGIITILLSTNPYPPRKADMVIKGRVKHLKLNNLFDEVHATKEYHSSKGEFMIKILKERGIPKNKALMVGDNYFWDYKPAKNNGIDAVLIETKHHSQKHPKAKKIKRKIKKMSEILNYV